MDMMLESELRRLEEKHALNAAIMQMREAMCKHPCGCGHDENMSCKDARVVRRTQMFEYCDRHAREFVRRKSWGHV